MIRTIIPGQRSGCVRIPSSKSQAHRLLIEAALGTEDTSLVCDGVSRDIEATAACLNALGADVRISGNCVHVIPIREIPKEERILPCGESGSTLRFLLPVAGALGVNAAFSREGRLPERPLTPLKEELIRHGMSISEDGPVLRCCGKLGPGEFNLPGNVSSQYISGLLMALPLLERSSTLTVTGKVESEAYITMTEEALSVSNIRFQKRGHVYEIQGAQRALLPQKIEIEGDWSNAAFFLSIGAVSTEGIHVYGLNRNSAQGDRAVLDILKAFGASCIWNGPILHVSCGNLHSVEIDASPIPDLIPVLSVVASVAQGQTHIVNAGRLRLKESDRLKSTTALLLKLGADIEELPEGLLIRGKPHLYGAETDSFGDHRIAMSAAVAATVCTGPVTVKRAECVQKSYPRFWDDFDMLTGGKR